MPPPSLRSYLVATTVFLAAEALSFLGFLDPMIGSISFGLIIGLTAWLTWKNLEYGLIVILAELLVGGKGYLFSQVFGSGKISIRIALFTVVIVIWLLRHRGNGNPLTRIPLVFRKWLIFLGVVLVWGVAFGLINQRGIGTVYFDANAFLFFLLAPVVFSPTVNLVRLRDFLLLVVAAATTVLGVKSLLSLGLFAHVDPGQLNSFYRWIRVTGVGEIAYINGNAYRVFFQSQIWGMFGAFLIAALLLPGRDRIQMPKWLFIPLVLGSTAVLISLSRSFWAGGLVALLTGIVLGFAHFRWNLKQFLLIGAVSLGIIGLSYTLTSWALNFPYPFPPSRGSQAAKLIGQRFETIGGEAAVSSRLNELEPLREGILRNPAIGSGFGTQLTYTSNDPRQLQSPNHGVYTTYAFEWGYLDLILKIGLIGLVMYLGLLWAIGRQLWLNQTRFGFGLLLALISLAVVHITTPYLNHPLGIGLLVLAIGLGSIREPKST